VLPRTWGEATAIPSKRGRPERILSVFFELLRIAFTVLRAHKFRAALTVLSITIGAFSVVVMSSLAKSGIATLSRGIEEMGGARMVAVFGKLPEKAERKRESYARGLTLDDLEALRGRLPRVRHLEMHNELGDRDIRFEARAPKRADAVGGNPDFLPAFGIKVIAGRGIDQSDMDGQRRVVVLGHGVAGHLFADGEDPLGRIVRVGEDSFRVVGVAGKVKRFGVEFGFDWNDFVLVPATAAAPGGVQSIGAILIVTDDASSNEMAKRVASAILLDRHRGVDDFQMFDFGALTKKFYDVFRIMQMIVALIAGVALLVGGVGVMNILLVSVQERVREIGIRKALGAPDAAIGLQFVFEAALLSGLGGAVGVIAGVGAADVIGAIIRRSQEAWVGVVSLEAVAGALVASLAIGLGFGILPARRAGKLQVVECLRAAG